MATNDLQKQLGLDLAVRQTAKMNNTPNYSFRSTEPLTGKTVFSVGVETLKDKKIDLGGGTATYNNGGGGSGGSSTQDTRAFSASPGVSAPVSTTNIGIGDTFSGIKPKKDRNIAQSTVQVGMIPPVSGVPTVPVSPTLNINQQQRLDNIAKRQGVAGIPPVTQPVTPISPDASATGLQGAELAAYNQLTPQEQKTFKALATQGIKAQTDYLMQSKAVQEYNKAQEDLFQQTEDNNDAIEDIQSRQQLEAAAKQVANLKQNIGYIGSGGQPGVSSAKLDAVSNQIALANKTYDDIVKIDQLSKANRRLGQESHALQFTRQMTQLQDDLDSKVNKQIQGALNQFNAAELKGKLDTIPEIEAFQAQLYAQLDGDLSSIMDTNIEARKFLIERYDKLAESQKTQMANAEKARQENEKRRNTINKEMSQARGYFVNDNGEPVIDQQTGARIVVPPETTTNYDASSGQLIMITKNADGTVGVSMKQVGAPKNTSTYQKIGTNPDTGEDIYGFVNAEQGTVTPYSVTPGMLGGGLGDIRSLAPQFPGQAWAKNNNPAGITWNSNFENATGTGGLFKQAGIQYEKGTSRPAKEGGNYVSFPTIEDGLKAQQIIMTQTYGNSTVGQMLSSWVGTSEGPNYAKQVASMAGVSPNVKVSSLTPEQLSTLQMAKIQKESPGLAKLLQGTEAQIQTQAKNPIASLGQFMKDNQDRGTGYSNDDVKAFNQKIDRLVKAGDEQGMAIAYRNMVMKDKDFKEEFDNTKKFTTALDTVQKMVSDYEKAGKDTNALKKVAEIVGRKLGVTTDTALAQLQTQMGTTMANYIKSISGTAASDAEVARLMGNMADIGNVQELNTAIISTVKDNAVNGLKSMVDTRMYGMPEELKPQVFGDIYQEEANKQKQVKETQKKLGVTGGLQDFMSELANLLK